MGEVRNVLIATDSFKGTLSSLEAANIIKDALLEIRPSLNVIVLPLADGGEGSLETIAYSLGGTFHDEFVVGPNFDCHMAHYLLKDDVAYIEAASCCGMTLAKKGSTPMETTSYGVGQLISDALLKGAKRIVLCIGGVATNDLGVGIAHVLGASFLDEDGESFVPVGKNLKDIVDFDLSRLMEEIKGAELQVLVDVRNPLYGPNGASRTYARQKGASEEEIELLEEGIIHLANLIKAKTGKDIAHVPGAGAAGGIGGGMLAFFDASFVSGIDTILNLMGFDRRVDEADLVITGEGKLDGQSLYGKAISGVASKAKAKGKPVAAVVGKCELDQTGIDRLGLDLVIESKGKGTLEEIRKTAKEDLRLAVIEGFKAYL